MKLFCITLALVFLACGCAFLVPADSLSDVPVYPCAFTTRAPVIDGRRDAVWETAVPVPAFVVPATGEPPVHSTTARLLWDDSCLYVLYEAVDPDVWAFWTKRDDSTCQDDCLELFIKPCDVEQTQYCNFEINARGTIYDAHVYRPGTPMSNRWRGWNCAGIRCAVQVDGTVNNWHSDDRGWTLEVAIPFASLPWLREAPQPGARWRFHVSRCEYSMQLEKGMELSSCAVLSRPSFHLAAEWIWLEFAR
ncbi:MAG: carbohydrate-binding family 9-like protein [Lentisphaeria bacterium]|nr:carbohydrate-binding family 9-like protein [Lentisphaeria bacterium]